MPSFTAAALAETLRAALEGDPGVSVTNVAELDAARPGDLVIAGAPPYLKKLPDCQASAALVPASAGPPPPPSAALSRGKCIDALTPAALPCGAGFGKLSASFNPDRGNQ